MDVEATTAIRQAEVGPAKTMLDRTAEQFDFDPVARTPTRATALTEMASEWLVVERGIDHCGSDLIDKSERTDGTFSRARPPSRPGAQQPLCLPQGQRAEEISPCVLHAARRLLEERRDPLSRRSARLRRLVLKPGAVRICSHARLRDPFTKPLVTRPCDRQDKGLRRLVSRTREGRDALRSSEAHPQTWPIAPARPNRAKDEFLLAATAQNLRKLAKLIPLPAPIFAT